MLIPNTENTGSNLSKNLLQLQYCLFRQNKKPFSVIGFFVKKLQYLRLWFPSVLRRLGNWFSHADDWLLKFNNNRKESGSYMIATIKDR